MWLVWRHALSAGNATTFLCRSVVGAHLDATLWVMHHRITHNTHPPRYAPVSLLASPTCCGMHLLGQDGAAYKGNLDEVKRLFSTGEACVTDRDRDVTRRRTALLWAIAGGQLHVVTWLVQEGGSSLTEKEECDNGMEMTDETPSWWFGQTAIQLAVSCGQWDVIRFFLDEGFTDIEDCDTGFEGKPLTMVAVDHDQFDIAKRLIREGTVSIQETSQRNGDNVLHQAIGHLGPDGIVKWYLEECKADVHARNNEGETALLRAVYCQNVRNVLYLLREHCADISDVDDNGRDVWGKLHQGCFDRPWEYTCHIDLADMYSVLRYYDPLEDQIEFIEGLPWEEENNEGLPFPGEYRDWLLQTERAFTNPNLEMYRSQRLTFLHEGSDFARLVIPDLQSIVTEYAQPSAEDQLSRAVVAEAATADTYALAMWQRTAQLQTRLTSVETENAALREQLQRAKERDKQR